MAICGKCGTQSGDAAAFCEQCGAPLATATAPPSSPPPPPGPSGPPPAPPGGSGIYGAQPGTYPPPPGNYTPGPGSYGQPVGGYAQAPGNYGQPPGGYPPPPGGYGQPPGGYSQMPVQPYNQYWPGPLAEWAPRALGILIDFACSFVVWLPFVILGDVTGSAIIGLLGDAASLGIWIWFAVQIGETGQSPGMRVVGLRCVVADTGQLIGPGLAVGRYFATWLNSFICWVGWLFPLWDGMKQTLADKIVSTVVCVVPKQPFNLVPTRPVG